jgi:hypothetical protein
LPQEKAEVKGRLLTEPQVNEVVTLLARNDALFEITAIDLGFHAESDVAAYKQSTPKVCSRVDRFREPDRTLVEKACHQISATSLPLPRATLFCAAATSGIGDLHVQRTKEKNQWEMWWSWYAR